MDDTSKQRFAILFVHIDLTKMVGKIYHIASLGHTHSLWPISIIAAFQIVSTDFVLQSLSEVVFSFVPE